MELNDVIYQRRSIRNYTNDLVDKDTINTLLKAAVQAPSAVNSQPWAFVVIQDADLLKQLSDRCKEFMLTVIVGTPQGDAKPVARQKPEVLCWK